MAQFSIKIIISNYTKFLTNHQENTKMKNINKILASAIFLFQIVYCSLSIDNCEAAVGVLPQFDISVRNVHTNPVIRPDGLDQDSLLDFDIYCLWTNSGVSDPFNYAGIQFVMNYNNGIVNGPITNNVTVFLTQTGSDLPPELRCVNPTIALMNGNYVLRLTPPFPVNINYLISTEYPGTKLMSLRFRTVTRIFNFQSPNLRFKVGGEPFITKIAYFDPDGLGVIFTDTTLFTRTYEENIILPVELAGFVSTTNRNNVTLNWSTSKEINNQGFDIERQAGNSPLWIKSGTVQGNGTINEPKNYSFTERVNSGKYNYRLKQTDYDGNLKYYYLNSEVEVGIPVSYNISQNYPNPFNPSTKIDLEIPHDGNVQILLYDISGREVAKIVNEAKTAGYYSVIFNASDLSSGIYFYIIKAGEYQEAKRMMLVK